MRGLTERQKWGLVAAGTGLVAGAVVKRALKQGWRAALDDDPPSAPERAPSMWGALAWAALSAAGVAVAKAAARRGAAYAWEELTGDAPPKRKRQSSRRRGRTRQARLKAKVREAVGG